MSRRELSGEVSRNFVTLRGERGTLNIEPLVRVDPGVNVLPNTFIKLVPRQSCNIIFCVYSTNVLNCWLLKSRS
jgi:hypothetical protein